MPQPSPNADTEARAVAEGGLRWPLGRAVTTGLVVFAAVWLSLLALMSLSPPDDNIEQLNWVRALEWGYYKHPPLPTWLLWLPVHIFGLSAAVSNVLGAACTLGALAIVWRLLVTLRGHTYAGIALLAMLCVTYYSRRLNYYNHEVVLMLLSAACAAIAWQAFGNPSRPGWIALGCALGLGALAKYQMAVSAACVLAFAIHRRAWRHPGHRRGLLLSVMIALVFIAPHLVWVVRHDFLPLHYALDSSLDARLSPPDRIVEAAHWLTDQLLNRALPAFLLLGVAAVTARERGSKPLRAEASSVTADGSRAFLLIWGLVPLAFVAATGLLFGARLPLHWGLPFLLFVVPAAMELMPRNRFRQSDPAVVIGSFLMIQGLLLVSLQLSSPKGILADRVRGWSRFDSHDLARDVAAAARARLGGPIRIVAGDGAIAGALALQLPERPLVLIGGRFDISPWVDPALLGKCGALEIGWDLADSWPVGSGHPGLRWRILPPLRNSSNCVGSGSRPPLAQARRGAR
ncbi:MAG: glycosyltransferase family 39 protein [Burkholderiales bacterium]|nr:glycosyltransferase family 39 protein [Burkholderiales bacterium]